MVNEDIMHVPALPEIEDISDHEEKIESETPENNIEERFTENSLENLPKEKEDGELTMSQSKR